MNKKGKPTSKLPLLKVEVEDQIYVHYETCDQINLGPFLREIYQHDNRVDLDNDFKRVITFINMDIGELISENLLIRMM